MRKSCIEGCEFTISGLSDGSQILSANVLLIVYLKVLATGWYWGRGCCW